MLPAAHHITSLIVVHFHILDNFLLCWRLRVRPKPQLMSDLPAQRSAIYEPSFSYTGVNYFGPIILKQSKKNKDKFGTISMLWCSVEMFNYQSSTSRRCRRFKHGFFHFSTVTIHSTTRSTKNNMEWKQYRWILGVYCENYKKVFDKYYKGQTYDLWGIGDFLTEIKAILYSRSLTQMSDDINDFNILTPNHFILGKQPSYFSPDTIQDDQMTSRTPWKVVQVLTKMFWRCFIWE